MKKLMVALFLIVLTVFSVISVKEVVKDYELGRGFFMSTAEHRAITRGD